MEVNVLRKLTFGVIALFMVTGALLIHMNSQWRDLAEATAQLRKHVVQLNQVVQRFQYQLTGPQGCKQQVGAWSPYGPDSIPCRFFERAII